MSWLRPFRLLFLILMVVVCPQRASASMGVQVETRVGGIELVVHALVGGSSARSPEKHLGSSVAYDEIAPGYSLAAETVVPDADAAQILQERVSFYRDHFAADPSRAAQHLTLGEQTAGPAFHAANFGKALERAVGADVKLNYPDLLRYVAGPNQPDFLGVGAAKGRTFDITTFHGQASHYARPYGDTLELILYETPKNWPN